MQKFLLPVQQSLDVMEKTDVKFGFSGQKITEKDHTHQLCTSKFFFCNAVLLVIIYKVNTIHIALHSKELFFNFQKAMCIENQSLD